MKIALFTDTYYPVLNGVTVSVNNLAEQLTKQGHTAYIFAPEVARYKKKEKNVYRLPSIQVIASWPEVRLPLILPRKVMNSLLPKDIDLIHAHGNGPFSLLGYQVAQGKGIPFVMTFHTQFTRYTHYIFNGKIIKPNIVAAGLKFSGNLCDAVIAPSEKMKKELISYGVKKPISVIPNFISPQVQFHKQKGFLHKLLDIPEDHLILLSVGRLAKEKNFPFLIRAFQKATKTQDNIHLVIAGYGNERKQLAALIRKLHCKDRIHLTGKIDPSQMPDVYADADIFVFASTTEIHPMAVLEAAAAGLPFVVVEDASYQNIVENGKNGFLTSAKQTEFAKKVLELINNKALREQFGKESKRQIKDHFDPDKVVTELISLYESVCDGYKPRTNMLNINRSTWVQLYRKALALNQNAQTD